MAQTKLDKMVETLAEVLTKDLGKQSIYLELPSKQEAARDYFKLRGAVGIGSHTTQPEVAKEEIYRYLGLK